MSAHFTIDVDPARDLVRISMSGLFEEADIERFLEARRLAHARLVCPPNCHVTLNDLRDMKIQPQDSVAAFRQMLSDPHYRSRRLAFVVAPTLAKMQLLRAIGGRNARFFEHPEEAEDWLFAHDEVDAQRRAYG
ncbi:hypothetical protein [Sphingosinicella terrae]|uniref:hypothetical protein n=1 Tax=Sphingosinicella terrae TaxID=2172047 RepID=UPI000E0D2EAA|nr:hypothetical protein [Sphingosinicella terrae]